MDVTGVTHVGWYTQDIFFYYSAILETIIIGKSSEDNENVFNLWLNTSDIHKRDHSDTELTLQDDASEASELDWRLSHSPEITKSKWTKGFKSYIHSWPL